MRKGTILLYIIFVVLFITHISFIAYKVFFDLPEVQVSKKPLEDIDFPLVFRVCGNEIENGSKKYQDLGYNNVEDFFRGKSMFNQSLFGWGGHLPNGSNIGTIEGKSLIDILLFHESKCDVLDILVMISNNWTTIIQSLQIYTTRQMLIQVPGRELRDAFKTRPQGP